MGPIITSASRKRDAPQTETLDVVGSLCENNEKFAIDRRLPKIERGDLLVIHYAGAHGHAMGFQYNGKLRCAELLLRPDGSVTQIRRGNPGRLLCHLGFLRSVNEPAYVFVADGIILERNSGRRGQSVDAFADRVRAGGVCGV